MMKKHLITCSVMIVLVSISTIFTYGKTRKKRSVKTKPHSSQFIFINNNDLSFADEMTPVNDKNVNYKIRHTLRVNNYKNIQSNILHRKAERLFPIIEPILKLYGIPDDFKYIPLVETGLKEGTSSKGAAGIWQFMPGTARTYGLRVGNGIDERKNVRKATIAACIYIKELYQEFNSWTLTAAAYNIGSIKLAKAIRQQSEDNYYRMHLNHETGTYVYKLIAMKEIISNPYKYGYGHDRNRVYEYLQPSHMLAAN